MESKVEVARLPEFSPAILWDWQALLPAVQGALETLHAKEDELERVQQIEYRLASQVRNAVIGIEPRTVGALLTVNF